LVDPQHQHSFCSRFDFTSEPLLYGMAAIPPAASATIHAAAALVVNGFVFDELDPTAVMQIVHDARAAHTPVFFDVGPRVCAFQGDRIPSSPPPAPPPTLPCHARVCARPPLVRRSHLRWVQRDGVSRRTHGAG